MTQSYDQTDGSTRLRSTIRFALEGIEGVVVLMSVLGSWPVSKWWLRNWRSSSAERTRRWPGDDLVAQNHDTYTRAIDIKAGADVVWQWIVQFGLGRAGFYSYELLERLVGIPVTNQEGIDPALQSLAVGDEIRLHPKAPAIPIAYLEPRKHICFGVIDDPSTSDARPDPARSWSMYLEPRRGEMCRLLLRGCVEPLQNRTWRKRLAGKIEEPIDFVMEQRMLRTIKRLAERHAVHAAA